MLSFVVSRPSLFDLLSFGIATSAYGSSPRFLASTSYASFIRRRRTPVAVSEYQSSNHSIFATVSGFHLYDFGILSLINTEYTLNIDPFNPAVNYSILSIDKVMNCGYS